MIGREVPRTEATGLEFPSVGAQDVRTVSLPSVWEADEASDRAASVARRIQPNEVRTYVYRISGIRPEDVSLSLVLVSSSASNE